MKTCGRIGIVVILYLLLLSHHASAQDRVYYRVYLTDKGTEPRVLVPSDPLYPFATFHLSPRALKRRAKVLPLDSLVSTDDLPVNAIYVDSISRLGGEIRQQSRWLNAVMILADSSTIESIRRLSFVMEVDQVAAERLDHPFIKPAPPLIVGRALSLTTEPSMPDPVCTSLQTGPAFSQNRRIGVLPLLDRGIAGEGVLVGILDAGFNWREHLTLREADVLAEYDFVHDDPVTSDEPGEPVSSTHGTLVMSVIGGFWPEYFIGAAPNVTFALAKTEDVSQEKHIEEDNFVAGLEWLESLGVDVTNTSLGYTTFDSPEQPFTREDLDGSTAFASRGLNHAVSLGVVCVVAAGNEFTSFRYVSVPAEADSAIAVAALDTAGNVAGFSSRGGAFMDRIKPDVAAPGVRIYGANDGSPSEVVPTQGTSLAAPLVTAGIAQILSVDPTLRPWEVRQLLQAGASRATSPDTAVGYGEISVDRSLAILSQQKIIVGFPLLSYNTPRNEDLVINAAIASRVDSSLFESNRFRMPVTLTLKLGRRSSGRQTAVTARQTTQGIATWVVPNAVEKLGPNVNGDTIDFVIQDAETGIELRHGEIVERHQIDQSPSSLLCSIGLPQPSPAYLSSFPSPFIDRARIEFGIDAPSTVSLDIFSSLGEQVMSLLHEVDLQPGVYSESFIGTNLPAGAYYYRLLVNGTVYSQQMIRL